MKSLNHQAADLLEAAGAVLWLPEWWTQGTFARDSNKAQVMAAASAATCYCAEGALIAAERDLRAGAFHAALCALADTLQRSPADFNDRKSTTSQAVATAMFKAADQLRSQA